jgi:hypothetical protein
MPKYGLRRSLKHTGHWLPLTLFKHRLFTDRLILLHRDVSINLGLLRGGCYTGTMSDIYIVTSYQKHSEDG